MNKAGEYMRPIVVLTLICAFVAGQLALTNGLTAPIIEQNEKETAEHTRRQLLPDAQDFTELPCEIEGVQSVFADTGGSGYIIEATGRGNNGDVNVTVGLDADGRIIALSVGTHSEDAGIGTRAFEKSYLDRFAGLSADAFSVDAVAGATYSSNALRQAVDLAFAAYKAVKSWEN